MTSIVEQIIHAGDLKHPAFWDPEPGPYFIPPDAQHPLGELLLTDAEFREVLDHFGVAVPTNMALWGIPVRIVDHTRCSETEHLTREEKP